jgi:hypothetical protein
MMERPEHRRACRYMVCGRDNDVIGDNRPCRKLALFVRPFSHSGRSTGQFALWRYFNSDPEFGDKELSVQITHWKAELPRLIYAFGRLLRQ